MPCLALSAKSESVSVYSDPSTQRGLPFALLLTLIGRKAQLTPAFIQGSVPEIALLTAIEATQIQQADSIQWLLLGLGTKESGLSFLHTTANATVCHFAREFIMPGAQGPSFLYSDVF